MRYEQVVKLYKNYELPTGTKRYLVGYFRNDGSASAEESYLRRAEKEPVPISFTTEVESATLYPDIVKRWEDEDAEREAARKEAERQRTAEYALPIMSCGWPKLFDNKTVDECFIELARKEQSILSFARHVGIRHRKHR